MRSPMLRHVFISYSRADSDFAARLIHDLEARGIGVWIDVEGLQPGTANWETSIREAISQAFAMIFVASPSSAQSGPVHGELSIGRDSNKTILPVWAAGEHWSSCAPFDMMRAQYIDLRANQYDANIDQLITAIEQQRPAHMVLEGRSIPHGYFGVELGSFGSDGACAFKCSAFASMRQFTDALYSTYLRGALAPFSYGSQWILASDAGPDQRWLSVRRLCVPFSWFLLPAEQRRQPLVRIDAHWADSPLASFGIKSDTQWRVMRVPESIFGIATNERILAEIIDSLTNARLLKAIEEILTDGGWQQPSEALATYSYRFVCTSDGGRRPYPSDKVLVPTMQDYYADYARQ